jgi:hypothetical protein
VAVSVAAISPSRKRAVDREGDGPRVVREDVGARLEQARPPARRRFATARARPSGPTRRRQPRAVKSRRASVPFAAWSPRPQSRARRRRTAARGQHLAAADPRPRVSCSALSSPTGLRRLRTFAPATDAP